MILEERVDSQSLTGIQMRVMGKKWEGMYDYILLRRVDNTKSKSECRWSQKKVTTLLTVRKKIK